MNQVKIEFTSKKHLQSFVDWFKREGFDMLTMSNENDALISDGYYAIDYLATDEVMDWGHYFEIE